MISRIHRTRLTHHALGTRPVASSMVPTAKHRVRRIRFSSSKLRRVVTPVITRSFSTIHASYLFMVLKLAATVIGQLIKNIEDLSSCLPNTVSEGTEHDEIYRVITTIQGHDEGSVASTFNRRFDILFKEDAQCRDENGRLHLIRSGELGMMMVVDYLRSIKWSAAEMDLEGAMVKLERIVKEMEFLWCVVFPTSHSPLICLVVWTDPLVRRLLLRRASRRPLSRRIRLHPAMEQPSPRRCSWTIFSIVRHFRDSMHLVDYFFQGSWPGGREGVERTKNIDRRGKLRSCRRRRRTILRTLLWMQQLRRV